MKHMLCSLGFLAACPVHAQPSPSPRILSLTVTYEAKSNPPGFITKFVEAYRGNCSIATVVFR